MGYTERLEIYHKIEQARSRPLITYVTSIRPNVNAYIAGDAISELIKQINLIPPKETAVDFLVISNGGDAIAAARIISLLRERFEKIAVLIPYVAYSAATLLAMGADEIIMHPYSNLGPVDPQLTVIRKSGDGNIDSINYGAEDLRNYFNFVRQDVGISDQEQMTRAFEMLCAETGPIPIGIAKRSTQLSLALGEKLLSLHMKDNSKAKAITETLSLSYHHHGYPLGRTDAEKVGLPVKKPSDEIDHLMWGIWENFQEEMLCDTAFNPLEIVLNSRSAEILLAPTPQVFVPLNLPPSLASAALQHILQTITVQDVMPVDYELLLSTMESTRCRSENRVKGKILATRLPDLNIRINLVQLSQGWTYFKN
ncbi:hypothetical protein [Candidatus Chlorohelix sp.]|uniref:SDH family Clp fold serine proteinase n=1 Tax=Candidatus Chlorohelix sp. TaxID=3139201 RepID=UPI00306A0F7A